MSKEISKESGSKLKAYWSNRYVQEMTGWDLGNASRPIAEYIDQIEDKELKILIPGVGNGYEGEYLHNKGFVNTYILDVSELPLQNFRKRVPGFPEGHILCADFFDLEDQFDLILEQTFFCSIPPIGSNRQDYVNKMHSLLKPKGKLAGLWFNFPYSGDVTKRPFGCLEEEYRSLFEHLFLVKTLSDSYNSVESRAGKELFGILQKK